MRDQVGAKVSPTGDRAAARGAARERAAAARPAHRHRLGGQARRGTAGAADPASARPAPPPRLPARQHHPAARPGAAGRAQACRGSVSSTPSGAEKLRDRPSNRRRQPAAPAARPPTPPGPRLRPAPARALPGGQSRPGPAPCAPAARRSCVPAGAPRGPARTAARSKSGVVPDHGQGVAPAAPRSRPGRAEPLGKSGRVVRVERQFQLQPGRVCRHAVSSGKSRGHRKRSRRPLPSPRDPQDPAMANSASAPVG